MASEEIIKYHPVPTPRTRREDGVGGDHEDSRFNFNWESGEFNFGPEELRTAVELLQKELALIQKEISKVSSFEEKRNLLERLAVFKERQNQTLLAIQALQEVKSNPKLSYLKFLIRTWNDSVARVEDRINALDFEEDDIVEGEVVEESGDGAGDPPEEPPVEEGGRDDDDDDESENLENEQVKVAITMYKLLREKNDRLPEFKDIDFEEGEDPKREYFFQNIMVALNKLMQGKINVTCAGGGTVLPWPSENADFWRHVDINIATTATVKEKNFEFFFENFPWDKVLGRELTAKEREEFVELWENRILHITQMHNFAKAFKDLKGKEMSPEHITAVIEMIGGKGEDGGFYNQDLKFFNMNRFEDGFLKEMLGEHDKSWLLPEFVLYYTRMMEKHFNNFQKDNIDSQMELKLALDSIFNAGIPDKFRLRDENGELFDQELLSLAWEITYWRLFVTLRLFEYDTGAVAAKLPQALRAGEYGPKVYLGAGNTGTTWTDSTINMVDRVFPPRSLFIHFNTEVDIGNNCFELTLSEVKDQRDFLRKVKEKDLLNRRDGRLNEEEKQRLNELNDLRIPDDGLSDDAQAELDRLNEFLLDVAIKAGGPDRVDSTYKIIKFKNNSTVMGLGGMPVAIPQAHFDFSRKNGHPKQVALSESQVVRSGVAHDLVDWDSCTPRHGSLWAKGCQNLIPLRDLMDLKNEKGALNLDAAEVDIFREVNLTDAIRDFSIKLQETKLWTMGSLDPEKIAELVRKNYLTQKITVADAMAIGGNKITQYFSRYGSLQMLAGGPATKGGETLQTTDVLRSLYRSENPNFLKERLKKNKPAIRQARKTVIPDTVSNAARIIEAGGGAARSGAEAQMMIFYVYLMFCATLDRYMATTYAMGEEISIRRGSDLETINKNIRPAYSGEKGGKVFNTAEVERLIDYMIILQEEAGNRLKGKYDGKLHYYSREAFREAARRRGFGSSQESAVVDLLFLKKIEEQSTGTDDKK